jgi:cytochrome P450
MNEQIQPSKGAPLFNPWSPEFIVNPYPSYHLLRETEPMHYMPLGLYVASRHADITTILRDKRFGKDFIGRMTRRAGPQILEEPVYRKHRWRAMRAVLRDTTRVVRHWTITAHDPS